MLLCHLWVNVATYYSWIINEGAERIEFVNMDDMDMDSEENKNEKNDQFQIYLRMPSSDNSLFVLAIWTRDKFYSIHHPEITTPPPERGSVLV